MFEKLGTFLRNDATRRTFGYYFLFIIIGAELGHQRSYPACTGLTNPFRLGEHGADLSGWRHDYLVFGSLVLNLLSFTGMLRLRPANQLVENILKEE